MSVQDEDDDRPRRDFSELMPIMLAMILTAAAIALCFFRFGTGGDHPAAAVPPPPAAATTGNSEVMVGVGKGSTLSAPTPVPAAKP